MRGITGKRAAVALMVSVVGLAVVGSASAGRHVVRRDVHPRAHTALTVSSSAVTRAFSFIGKPNSGRGKVIINIDGLVVNARCNASGEPVIYAFSNAPADLFGRVFDGFGRLTSIKQSAFVKGNKGVLLSVNNGDFDASGNVLYETISSRVVTVSYAFDNSTTLARRNVCTVYGSFVAS